MLSSVLEIFCIYKVSEICLESMNMTSISSDTVVQGYQTIFSSYYLHTFLTFPFSAVLKYCCCFLHEDALSLF